VNAAIALARPEIVTLNPYSHAAWRPELTRLHANEAPWRPDGDSTVAGLNRYPESQPQALIGRLAALYGVPADCVLVGRGADEAIDVLSRVYLRAGQDAILQCTPTFGMYEVAARIQGAGVVSVPLRREQAWSLDVDAYLAAWRPHMKIVYLCSPNNPTANAFPAGAVEHICATLDGKAVVVVDEAYVEWSQAPSVSRWLERFETLAILRTLSKAHALAGARIGTLLANPDLIRLAQRVIPPYALAQPTIEAALRALEPAQLDVSRARLTDLLAGRDSLRAGLEASPLIARVWPSAANFLLVDCHDAESFMKAAIAGGSLVRDMRAHPALRQSLRISVGSPGEIAALLRSVGTP
jgi:histidinol-phosphate aminotransferase